MSRFSTYLLILAGAAASVAAIGYVNPRTVPTVVPASSECQFDYLREPLPVSARLPRLPDQLPDDAPTQIQAAPVLATQVD